VVLGFFRGFQVFSRKIIFKNIFLKNKKKINHEGGREYFPPTPQNGGDREVVEDLS
jgi:hypothetical protein